MLFSPGPHPAHSAPVHLLSCRGIFKNIPASDPLENPFLLTETCSSQFTRVASLISFKFLFTGYVSGTKPSLLGNFLILAYMFLFTPLSWFILFSQYLKLPNILLKYLKLPNILLSDKLSLTNSSKWNSKGDMSLSYVQLPLRSILPHKEKQCF